MRIVWELGLEVYVVQIWYTGECYKPYEPALCRRSEGSLEALELLSPLNKAAHDMQGAWLLLQTFITDYAPNAPKHSEKFAMELIALQRGIALHANNI